MTTTAQGVRPGQAAAGNKLNNDRLLGALGLAGGFLATFMIGIFWAMGAVLKSTSNGGTVVQLDLQGVWNTLFWAYPWVALASVVLGVGAYALGRPKEAAGVALIPAIAVVVYYIALVQIR